MMQRAWTLVSSFVMLTAVGVVACSSADTPEGDDDDGTTGGTSSGATGGTGGSTAGTGAGGTGATGGAGAAGGTGATGGTAPTGGAGGAGGVNSDPECKGIRSNMPCMPEGKDCQSLVCGLADSGTRSCLCATNWSCMPCDFTNSMFRDRPAEIPACPPEAADEVACTQLGLVCGPNGSEYCACYQDATDGLIWDCDSPPSSWGM